MIEPGERGIEARELAELSEAARQHEAIVRVEAVFVGVARADQVLKGERVSRERELERAGPRVGGAFRRRTENGSGSARDRDEHNA